MTAFALVLAALAPAYAADEALAPLAGKSIRFIITNSAGSEADRFARIFARHLQAALPETAVLVQNVAGGSGLVGAKEIFDATGSRITVGFLNASVVFTQLVEPDETPFDLAKFQWVGSVTTSQHLLAVRKGLPADPAKLTEPMTLASRSASSSAAVLATLLNAMTPLRFKVVPGVQAEEGAAMLIAGDLDAAIQSVEGLRPLLDAGDIAPVLRFAKVGYAPQFDTVATLSDIALPSVPKELIATIEQLNDIGRLVAAAPATDTEAVSSLQAAFDRIVADAAYEADIEAAGFENSPEPGVEVAAAIQSVLGGSTSELLSQYRACGKLIAEDSSSSCN